MGGGSALTLHPKHPRHQNPLEDMKIELETKCCLLLFELTVKDDNIRQAALSDTRRISIGNAWLISSTNRRRHHVVATWTVF